MEGMTGRLLATCPSSHSWSVIPTLTDWGYRLSAQRGHGTHSYSTTSPSRSCSDSTYAANEHPAVHAGVGALEAGVVRLYGVVIVVMGVYPRCVHSL